MGTAVTVGKNLKKVRNIQTPEKGLKGYGDKKTHVNK